MSATLSRVYSDTHPHACRILKSIWYRLNNFNNSKPTRLSKVYFTWVIRDFGSAEWFHSLLHAIEEQDTQNRIEINIYLTAKIKEEDMNNIIVQDVGAEKDAITSLRAPTHFGRPNWDRVFSSIAEKHPETDVGVFFCGPAVLSRQLHHMSNKYSSPKGTKFFFGKGALRSSCSLILRSFQGSADCGSFAEQQRTSKRRCRGAIPLLQSLRCRTVRSYTRLCSIYSSLSTVSTHATQNILSCCRSVGWLAPVVCTRPFVPWIRPSVLLVIVLYTLLAIAIWFGSQHGRANGCFGIETCTPRV